ncbi:MAG: hypothetical protein ACRDUA_04845 [Micromonosporaceae bacterium]
MTSDNRVIGCLADRIRPDRRIAGIAAAGLLGAILAPGIAVEPAAATACESRDFSAMAAADLMNAELKSLEPLGVDAPARSGITVAAARSWVNSNATTKSRASVDYLDAELLGRSVPAGPLDASVSQSAPPNNTRPATVRPEQVNAELLRLGPGPMSAHATWKKEYGCRTRQGVIAESYVSDLDAAVLPAMTTGHEHGQAELLGTGLVALPSNAFSRTATGLVRREGTMTTAASAWTGMTELVLFQGTERETTVRVVNPPELTGLATGSKRSSAVEYTSPILEVVTADGTSRRLDAPGEVVTITVPPGTHADTEKTTPDSEASKAPEHPGLPDGALPDPDAAPDGTDRGLVGGLLGGLTGAGGSQTGDPDAPSGENEDTADPGSGEKPKSGGTEQPDGEAPGRHPESGESRTLPAMAVRLGLGHLDSTITDRSVRAEAASVRLQLMAVRGEDTTAMADVGLGMLKVHATAPKAPAPSNPPVTTPPSSGGGGSLPITGFNLLAVLAGGALLLAAGRFLMVVGRRRDPAGPPPL